MCLFPRGGGASRIPPLPFSTPSPPWPPVLFLLVLALAILLMAAVFGGLVFHTLCCLCWRTGALARLRAWCLCVVWLWCVAPSVLLYTCVLHGIHSLSVSLHTILLFRGAPCCVYLLGSFVCGGMYMRVQACLLLPMYAACGGGHVLSATSLGYLRWCGYCCAFPVCVAYPSAACNILVLGLFFLIACVLCFPLVACGSLRAFVYVRSSYRSFILPVASYHFAFPRRWWPCFALDGLYIRAYLSLPMCSACGGGHALSVIPLGFLVGAVIVRCVFLGGVA